MDLPFIDDPANVELSFLRSRVRHEVIPILEKTFGHDVVPHLAAFAERIREEQEALDRDAQAVLFDPQVERTPIALVVPTDLLESQSPSLQKRCVVRALELLQGQPPRIKALHLESVVEAVARRQPQRKVTLPGGWEVSVGPRAVRIGHPAPEEPPLDPVALPYPGSTDVPQLGMRVHIEKRRVSHEELPPERGSELYVGEGAVRGALTLRTRRPGDTIVPLGSPGRRKLKKVLIDRKVPRSIRERLAVITTGEGPDEEVLWVVGVVMSETCRLAPDATEAWHLQVEPMMEEGGGAASK
jgi:tRNA(Ile)-lysidine synthase